LLHFLNLTFSGVFCVFPFFQIDFISGSSSLASCLITGTGRTPVPNLYLRQIVSPLPAQLSLYI
jgi:hypothetical protein